MSTSGVSIVTEKNEKSRFINFPYDLYSNAEHYVPPLRMDQKKLLDESKNPFYENAEIALFIAEKDGKDAGRIAAIVDHRYNEYHDSETGHFGFFDCIEDQHTANLLFRVAEDWLRDKGMTDVLGPANPSMMDTIGVLIEGYNKDPYILMPYNYPYYDKLITNAGYDEAQVLLAYLVDTETVSLDRMRRAGEIVKKRNPGLSIRTIDLKNLDEEIQVIRKIYNRAWADNWGFIPLTEKEFDAAAADLKLIVNPAYAHMAEMNGEPIGFSIALPNINRLIKNSNGRLFPFTIFKLLFRVKKLTDLRTALMGVIPEYRGKGIDAILHFYEIENALATGKKVTSEMSWILESNRSMIRVAERIGGTLDKKYRMYTKEL